MKTQNAIFFTASFFAAALFAAAPVVDNVNLDISGANAVVTYDLSGADGIVTMEIQTNVVADLSGEWVALDGNLVRNASGDVSCLVAAGSDRRIVWNFAAMLGRTRIKNARAVLTAWSTNAPPDWCIGDLTGADVPRYYTATNYFPLGFGNDVYKTSKIVFKRVRAKGKSFSMGQPTTIDTYSGGGVHPVTLARDYYLAIYETTQAQYHYATGQKSPWNVTQWPNDQLYTNSVLPYLIGWWDNARGGDFAADGYGSALSSSFVGKARTKTGLLIDLPTEAEWEFAARCGGMRTKNQLVNGEDAAAITDVAWVSSNSDNIYHDVGLLLPNDWGFYDMIGNVAEWCLDPVTSANDKPPSLEGTEGFDPIGTAGAASHVNRGSHSRTSYGYNVTARSTYGMGQAGYGFRTVAIIEPHDFSSEPDVADVTLFQNTATRTIKIGYNLTGDDKIVTMVIETNTVADASGEWVALPEQTTSSAYGDVNRIVKAGAGSKWIYWNPDESFADETIASGAARAVLTAWATNTPPNYMVVDLTGNSIVRYYVSTNAIPDGGLSNPIYRTRYMVFRKIPAKDIIWLKGVDPATDTVSGWTANNLATNAPHRVKLTYDYYIGIYELTRAQACTISGTKAGDYGTCADIYSYVDTLPGGGCYFTGFSNRTTAKLNTAEWFGGQYTFNVESDAEWEFACRAGEPKVLYSGNNYSRNNLAAIANLTADLAEGGTMPCNRWGLYDMLGNMAEICRDSIRRSDGVDNWSYWKDDAGYQADGYITDPEGTGFESSIRHVLRGFYALGTQSYQVDNGTFYTAAAGQNNKYGTRLVCPIPNDD